MHRCKWISFHFIDYQNVPSPLTCKKTNRALRALREHLKLSGGPLKLKMRGLASITSPRKLKMRGFAIFAVAMKNDAFFERKKSQANKKTKQNKTNWRAHENC